MRRHVSESDLPTACCSDKDNSHGNNASKAAGNKITRAKGVCVCVCYVANLIFTIKSN
jgi:hypothetical protein